MKQKSILILIEAVQVNQRILISMNDDDITINSYNQKAEEISAKFRAIGVRIDDINRAVELTGKDHLGRVVELGSADGRDAIEIATRTISYVGVEPSDGLLAIARRENPSLDFVKGNAQTYNYLKDTDLVFAFASLLHVSREDLSGVLKKIHESLIPGGILYISMKEADEYTPRLDNDQWGSRQFYLYSVENILEIAPVDGFAVAYEEHQQIGDTPWFTLALKKI